MGSSSDKNDGYRIYGGTGRGTRMRYYGGDGRAEGQGGYGGRYKRNFRHASRAQGRGIRSTTVNRRNNQETEEENMVTPEKNGGIQWGYGLGSAEWQKAGKSETTISKLNMGETGKEKHEEGNAASGEMNTMVKAKRTQTNERC